MSFTIVNSPALALLQQLAGQPLPEPERAAPQHLQLTAGEPLMHAGTPHPHVYVVNQGLLKLHYLQEDGSEWVKSFCHEGMFFGSLAALQPGGLASFSVSALEPCRLERLGWAPLMALAERHPAWMRALFEAMRRFAARKEQREFRLLTRRPEQRYRALAQEEPELLQRVPLKELARYLGITAASLSRIRARERSTGV